MDGQTERQTTYCGITALCVDRAVKIRPIAWCLFDFGGGKTQCGGSSTSYVHGWNGQWSCIWFSPKLRLLLYRVQTLQTVDEVSGVDAEIAENPSCPRRIDILYSVGVSPAGNPRLDAGKVWVSFRYCVEPEMRVFRPAVDTVYNQFSSLIQFHHQSRKVWLTIRPVISTFVTKLGLLSKI